MKSPLNGAVVLSLTKRLAWPLIFFAGLLSAQQAAPSQNNSLPPTDPCLQRSIPLTILRRPPKPQLNAAELQVWVDGNRTSVVSLKQDKISPRVVLLVDTSASMTAPYYGKWGTGLLTARFAVDAIPEESDVALVTFSDQIHVSGFQERQRVSEQLLALKDTRPKGRTALHEAIGRSAALFGLPQFGDVIYIVSDGGDNRSGVSRKAVEEELTQRGIRAFVFLIQHDAKTPEERQGAVELPEFAKQTGGFAISLPVSARGVASKEATQEANSIREQVRSPYRLDLKLDAPPVKAAKLKITLSSAAFDLSYPQHVEPCQVKVAAANP
jgi:Mg-chelatase subunit ChlD